VFTVVDVGILATFSDDPDTVLNKGGKETSKMSHIGFAGPGRLT
jgi:hypothetical protein